MRTWKVKKLAGRTVYGVINDQGTWYQSRVTERRYSTRNVEFALEMSRRLNSEETERAS